MEEYIRNLLKYKKLEIPKLKDHDEVVKFILQRTGRNDANLQLLIGAIYKHQEYFLAFFKTLLLLLCKELGVDYSKLQEAAQKIVINNWGEIKKELNKLGDELSMSEKINEIFEYPSKNNDQKV